MKINDVFLRTKRLNRSVRTGKTRLSSRKPFYWWRLSHGR